MEAQQEITQDHTTLQLPFYWVWEEEGDGNTIGFYSTLEKALAGAQYHMVSVNEIDDITLELHEFEGGGWRNGVYFRETRWEAGGYGIVKVDRIDVDLF